MGSSIHTEITIAASPERVWAVFSDFASYPQWNTFIPELSGEMRVGSKLTLKLQPPGSAAITIKPTVTAYEPGKLFEWLGHLIVPGIFDGRHRFEIFPLPDGSTRFVQSEQFGGITIPLLTGVLKNAKIGFERLNSALAERCTNLPS